MVSGNRFWAFGLLGIQGPQPHEGTCSAHLWSVRAILAIIIAACSAVTANAADDKSSDELYAERLRAAERKADSAKAQNAQNAPDSKTWEQRAQEDSEAYQKRHEDALRRESPADRAARERENERLAAERAAHEAWCAEHPVECAKAEADRQREQARAAEVQAARQQREVEKAQANARWQAAQAEHAQQAQAAAQQAAAQHDAARHDAMLDARVINVLSSGYLTAGASLSPDQQRVYNRAQAIAEEQCPSPKGNCRYEIINRLMSDEAFIRETLK